MPDIEFLLALCGSFIQDFDLFLYKYAPNGNHRALPTHSIWPGIAMIMIGGVFGGPWIIVAGLNSILHILLDTLDWGVAFFGTKKLLGPKILVRGLTVNPKVLAEKYTLRGCFFTLRWFRNPWMKVLEVGSIVGLAIVCILLNDANVIPIVLLYCAFAFFHYFGLIRCLRKNNARKD